MGPAVYIATACRHPFARGRHHTRAAAPDSMGVRPLSHIGITCNAPTAPRRLTAAVFSLDSYHARETSREGGIWVPWAACATSRHVTIDPASVSAVGRFRSREQSRTAIMVYPRSGAEGLPLLSLLVCRASALCRCPPIRWRPLPPHMTAGYLLEAPAPAQHTQS